MPRLPQIPVWTDRRRENKFEAITAVYESKGIPFKDYRATVIGLVESQRAADAKKESRRLVKAESKAVAQAKAKVARAETKARIASIDFIPPRDLVQREIYRFAEQNLLAKKKFRVRITGFKLADGDEGQEMTIINKKGEEEVVSVVGYYDDREVPSTTKRNIVDWWNKQYYYSDAFATSITFYKDTPLLAERRTQAFRDGVSHCVLDVMEENLNRRVEAYSNKYDKNKGRRLISLCKEFKRIYDAGIPENKMEEVCKALKFNVMIYDILDNELFVFNKAAKHRLSYCNVRLNHLEVGRLALTEKALEVSQEELDAILAAVVAKKEFYVYEGNPKDGKVYGVRTVKGAWKVKNEKIDEMNECNKKNNIHDYALNATAQKELNDYIKEGRIINSTNCIVNGGFARDHLDLKAAYTQWTRFKDAKFLGKIWKFGKLKGSDVSFMAENIGIYRFRVKEIRLAALKRLGFKVGQCYTLPSVEILLMIQKGWVSVELVSGVWGSAVSITLDANMTDERKLYQEWAGRLGMEYDRKVFIFPGNADEASHLAGVLGEDMVSYYEYTGFIHVARMKKMMTTLHHVFAFITAYTRMNILLKMEDVGFENVSSVVLDGIYLTKKVEADEVFRRKPINQHTETRCWYYPSVVSDDFMPEFNTFFTKGIPGRMFLQGQGGSGKSEFVFRNMFMNKDLLYIVPTRDLGIKKKEEFKNEVLPPGKERISVNWTTIQKLVGSDYVGEDGKVTKCRSWKDEAGRSPAIGFIDEVTMTSGAMIEKALEMYPNTLFIIAGDVEGKQWFQCRNGDGQSYTKLFDVSEWPTMKFEKDWRAAKSPELIELKKNIREQMRKHFTDGGRKDAKAIEEWVEKNVKTKTYEEAVQMFEKGDLWIAPTNAISSRLLKDGVCSGYRCKHEGKDKDGVFRTKGEILSEGSGALTEKRGSITCHAIQGKTIKTGKIFICLTDNFEYAQIYTAISRAVRIEQLVFVS